MVRKMKRAVLYNQEELVIEQADIPEIAEDEILLKNKVSLTCGTDVKIYHRGYPRLKPPHPFGHELSGVVEKVGSKVTKFAVGDRVATHNTAPCNKCYYCKNHQHSMCDDLVYIRGAHAEYVRIPAPVVEQNMFLIDDNMSHKTAALMEPFSCAVYGVDECNIRQGDTVVIIGVGPIGLMFARLAVLKGARVIVSDMVASRLEIAKKQGVWKVVNAKDSPNSTEEILSLTDDKRGADIVIEATGLIPVWEESFKLARKGGMVLLFGGTKSGSKLTVDATQLHYEQITIKGIYHTTPRHVLQAFELLKLGVIKEDDFIDNEYPLEDLEKAVLEHSSGKVIKNAIIY